VLFTDSNRVPYEGSDCSRLHAPKNPRADVFAKKFARVDGPLAVIATKASVQIALDRASAMMQLFIAATRCTCVLNFQELARSRVLSCNQQCISSIQQCDVKTGLSNNE
jgi:hypothetical protein